MSDSKVSPVAAANHRTQQPPPPGVPRSTTSADEHTAGVASTMYAWSNGRMARPRERRRDLAGRWEGFELAMNSRWSHSQSHEALGWMRQVLRLHLTRTDAWRNRTPAVRRSWASVSTDLDGRPVPLYYCNRCASWRGGRE